MESHVAMQHVEASLAISFAIMFATLVIATTSVWYQCMYIIIIVYTHISIYLYQSIYTYMDVVLFVYYYESD